MEKTTNWNSLWRELVEIKAQSRQKSSCSDRTPDPWLDRAHKFKEGVHRRWEQSDSSREFICAQLDKKSTLLDIGAGTGAWSILLSPYAKHITAIEPSNSMIAVMRESLTDENILNVSILQGSWPDITVDLHDYSLCSHAMYGYPDLAAFIRKMTACTRRMCFLLLRAPATDGIQAEVAQHLWGQPMDSPNFVIAYNVLIQMGIYANVLMENTGYWKPRTSTTIEDALFRLKRGMGLAESKEHDEYLLQLLKKRLQWNGEKYTWPQEIKSALVYWEAGK
jgi:2-polyprenyl-3-methyl-5-hydroxy-6-metoxy-1,4-benzoquinol methylase